MPIRFDTRPRRRARSAPPTAAKHRSSVGSAALVTLRERLAEQLGRSLELRLDPCVDLAFRRPYDAPAAPPPRAPGARTAGRGETPAAPAPPRAARVCATAAGPAPPPAASRRWGPSVAPCALFSAAALRAGRGLPSARAPGVPAESTAP